MKIYRVQIIADKYPTEYTIQASSWGTAISRAIREWKKKFKGSRADQLTVKAFKGGDLLRESEHDQSVEK